MNLDDYIPVDERLRRALAEHPELRIQELDATFQEVPYGLILICRVSVWRSPDDPLPTVASASEPYPGRTPYTLGSERMVGMTSALGRCLGYMGYGLEAGIASANEVAARQQAGEAPIRPSEPRQSPTGTYPPTDGQIRMLRALGSTVTPTSKAEASKLIDALKAAKVETAEEPF